jgi:cobyrinic acid a,c-diamide synthase
MKPQLLIAAPSSNSGKTTVTLGLLRLLKNKGYHVQPFKCGPDYIDTKHHALAAHKPSINLDTFMMSADHVKNVYHKYSKPADITIVEGVMGLFDGANKMQGSSAEIAMLLNIPVILVVNAKAMAYSVAPLIYGFKQFDPRLKIAGVIFNFVNTESHYQFLKDACDDIGVEALGYIPANDSIRIPSRHLGLAISEENDYEKIIQQAAEQLEKTVLIKRLLEICSTGSTAAITNKKATVPVLQKKINISIAKDAAFNFMYQENIEILNQLGQVTFFSPMKDHSLPATDLLYLPGGYPELYAEELSTNHAMKTSIHAFCENGGKAIAECGGMMYLGKELLDKEGKKYSMVNFLDIETSMQHAKLSLGYRNIVVDRLSFNGHEFHYSTCSEKSTIASMGEVFNAKGMKVNSPIYQQKNVIASYIHFYWGENAELLDVLFSEKKSGNG